MSNVISFASVVLVSSCQIKSCLLAGLFKQFSVQNNRRRVFLQLLFFKPILKTGDKTGRGEKVACYSFYSGFNWGSGNSKFVYMSRQRKM